VDQSVFLVDLSVVFALILALGNAPSERT
jgi:hypothetical protein